MSARITLLAEALKIWVNQQLFLNDITGVTVKRTYGSTYDLGKISSRYIDIFTPSYVIAEPASRSEGFYDFNFSFIVIDRYTLGGDVPIDWMDNLINFVQTVIVKPLDRDLIELNSEDYIVSSVVVPTVYDYDIFRQHRVFWSEVELSIRGILTEL